MDREIAREWLAMVGLGSDRLGVHTPSGNEDRLE
jgi:hypothetical protein